MFVLQRWDSLRSTFTPLLPSQLGLVWQLGHGGATCPFAPLMARPLVVLHINGIHNIRYRLCDCSGAPRPRIQMLRSSLFPATLVDPGTCATFQLLREYHILSLQAKLSMHHYYVSLEHQTSNTGLHSPTVSLVELKRSSSFMLTEFATSPAINSSVEWCENGDISSS